MGDPAGLPCRPGRLCLAHPAVHRPAAEFLFVDDPDDVPADATAFDMPRRRALAPRRRLQLRDLPAARTRSTTRPSPTIGRIVHEADLADERFDAPEARGLDVLIRGLSMTSMTRRRSRSPGRCSTACMRSSSAPRCSVASQPKRRNDTMKWVTREHPKTDRIACPWLIRKFIDPDAEIVYVPTRRGPGLRRARRRDQLRRAGRPATPIATASARSRRSSTSTRSTIPRSRCSPGSSTAPTSSEDLDATPAVARACWRSPTASRCSTSTTSASSSSSCPCTTPCTPGHSTRSAPAERCASPRGLHRASGSSREVASITPPSMTDWRLFAATPRRRLDVIDRDGSRSPVDHEPPWLRHRATLGPLGRQVGSLGPVARTVRRDDALQPWRIRIWTPNTCWSPTSCRRPGRHHGDASWRSMVLRSTYITGIPSSIATANWWES